TLVMPFPVELLRFFERAAGAGAEPRAASADAEREAPAEIPAPRDGAETSDPPDDPAPARVNGGLVSTGTDNGAQRDPHRPETNQQQSAPPAPPASEARTQRDPHRSESNQPQSAAQAPPASEARTQRDPHR